MDRRFRGFAKSRQMDIVRRLSTTIPRGHALRDPTHLDSIVFETVKKLFARHCDRSVRVRLVGVALPFFTHGGEQLDLLDPPGAKNKSVWRKPPTPCATASAFQRFNSAAQ
jgi:hypothetical protein